MYKYSNIGRDILKVIITSLIVAAVMTGFSGYEFSYVFIGLLIANTVLTASYKYTVEINRPVVFTIMFVFYICLAGYSRQYIGYMIKGEGIQQYILRAGTMEILLASCMTVLITNIDEIGRAVKRRVDTWFIPMYIVVIAGFLILELNEWVMPDLKRISYFFLSIGVTIVCLYAGEKNKDNTIRYDINTKGYLWYMSLVLLIIVLGGIFLPKPEYLPGAKWFQQNVLKLDSSVETNVRLNRTPKMSENILYRVESDEPLYLRSLAYSDYSRDSWSVVDDSNMKSVPLENLDFDFEYGVTCSDFAKQHRAYIYEEKSSDSYLTTNGTYQIEVEDIVQSMGDINNICFKEGEVSNSQRGYTIKYYNRNDGVDTTRFIGLWDRNMWDRFIELVSEDTKLSGAGLLEYNLDTDDYWELYDKYTQIPEELAKPFYNLASKIAIKSENQIDAAKAIEEYLKYSGQYKYVYGAKKKDIMADTIYDFIFNGKEGICQDFASSMTLLCRSIGLPTRYVAGYYSEEKDEEGKYVIRGKNAHAFVEVYITGYGWMLFDPTPGITEESRLLIKEEKIDSGGISTGEEGRNVNKDSILQKEMIYPLIILIVIWYISRVGYNIYWRRSLLQKDNGKAIVIIYEKTLELLHNMDYMGDSNALRQIALNVGVDIYPIVYPYERYYYGDKAISKEQVEEALVAYNKLLKNKGYIIKAY